MIEEKTCPNCGVKINKNDKFCRKCGFEIQTELNHFICPNCGNKIDNDSSFCSDCGKSLNNNQITIDTTYIEEKMQKLDVKHVVIYAIIGIVVSILLNLLLDMVLVNFIEGYAIWTCLVSIAMVNFVVGILSNNYFDACITGAIIGIFAGISQGILIPLVVGALISSLTNYYIEYKGIEVNIY